MTCANLLSLPSDSTASGTAITSQPSIRGRLRPGRCLTVRLFHRSCVKLMVLLDGDVHVPMLRWTAVMWQQVRVGQQVRIGFGVDRTMCTASPDPLIKKHFIAFMASRPGRFLGLAGPAIRPMGQAGPGFRPDHDTGL